ncbi:MAG: DUF456 domain-containing protein [Candidatus Omnitrophota bacterium]|nr:DUF456 domain-containing protein [Candidatus Omnitrophota bacterium]
MIMNILALSVLLIFTLAGIIAIFFTTFGTLLILVGTILYALMTGFSVITLKVLVILCALYLFGEVLEYVFIVLGAKNLGASNAAVFGAIIGGVLGAVAGTAFFGVGLIAGTFLGIFLGAFLVELILQRDLIKSMKAGTGGVLGRLGSIAAKLVIAFAMLSIVIYRITS